MRSGRFGDDTADAGTTCEEDLVPALSQQCLCLGDTSLDNGVARWVERCLHDLLDDHGALGRILTRLDNDSVSTGNSSDHRPQGQLEWVVESSVSQQMALLAHVQGGNGKPSKRTR